MTMIGPDVIKECSECSGRIRMTGYHSYNSIGGMSYTDGETVAPMLPEFYEAVRCPWCTSVAWLENYETFEEVLERILGPLKAHKQELEFKKLNLFKRTWVRMKIWYEEATSQPEVPPPSKQPEYLSWKDYEELADSGLRPDREIYVRTYLWHGWNSHRRRRIENKPCLPLSVKEIANLESLYDLLDSDYWKTCLTKAEIKRELSQFDEAVELTDDLLIGDDEEVNRAAVMQIRKLAIKRDPFVAPMYITGDMFIG